MGLVDLVGLAGQDNTMVEVVDTVVDTMVDIHMDTVGKTYFYLLVFKYIYKVHHL